MSALAAGTLIAITNAVPDSTVPTDAGRATPSTAEDDRTSLPSPTTEGSPVAVPEKRAQVVPFTPHRDVSDRLISELIDAVKGVLRKEASDRLRDVYLIGDIEKDPARGVIERLRELANDNARPITVYINSAGGNVTDGLAIHDSIREIVRRGIEVTIVVQGMAYSMGSIVLQAASPGRIDRDAPCRRSSATRSGPISIWTPTRRSSTD